MLLLEQDCLISDFFKSGLVSYSILQCGSERRIRPLFGQLADLWGAMTMLLTISTSFDDAESSFTKAEHKLCKASSNFDVACKASIQ